MGSSGGVRGQLERQLLELAAAGFDLAVDTPFRARLFELGEDEHVLAIVMHHISADGWSMAPLARDVMVAYSARREWERPAWAMLPVQYADFAIWERAVLGDESDSFSLASRQLAYWTKNLDGLPEELPLPFDRPRGSSSTYRGGRVEFTIDAGIHRGLRDLSQQNNSTIFMAVHAALAVLLSRLSASEDVVIGTPVAGRGEAALDDMVGMFVNTLVLRTIIDPSKSYTEVLREASETALAAFAHSDIPFERIVEKLNPPRIGSRHPLFQVALAFQNLEHPTLELGVPGRHRHEPRALRSRTRSVRIDRRGRCPRWHGRHPVLFGGSVRRVDGGVVRGAVRAVAGCCGGGSVGAGG